MLSISVLQKHLAGANKARAFHPLEKRARVLRCLSLGLGVACFGCTMTPTAIQAKPSIEAITPSSNTIERLDKFELTFGLSGTGYSNPFDPAQIDVDAVFTSPSKATVTVEGFYYQSFSRSGPPEKLVATGTPVWKVRFTPTEEGVWTYVLKVTDKKTGEAVLSPRQFTCVSSRRKGFIQQSAKDKRYFQYSDGTQYVPIGQNLGWGNWGMDNGTYSYDSWLPKIADQGGNFARYWMWADFHGIEWKETGLGDYTKRLNEAWRLDHDVEVARKHNIQVMLMLLDHGAVSTVVNPKWTSSPYYTGNGGPCATPRDFFTNPAAKEYFKRRLRYTVARWGYASNLIWELTNEIDNIDKYITDAGTRADVATWHQEMAAYIKGLDNRHLVSTSFSRFQDDPAIWNQPHIDFTQFHLYSTSPTMEDLHGAIIQRYRKQFPTKPVFGGEVGFPAGGEYSVANDPQGIHWHNAQWASLLSGAAGTTAIWWWADYVEPRNLYTHYRGISNFVSSLDMAGSGFVPTRPSVTTPEQAGLLVTGYPEWGFKAESNRFVVTANGTLVPGEDQLAAYLYDARDNAERHNPPTFAVNYPTAGSFKLLTGTPNGQAKLVVTVDGKTVYSETPPAHSAVTIPIPAGAHSISVDNVGTGWVEAVNYLFTPIAPTLKVYALQGPTTVAAWIVNRDFNYAAVRDKGLPRAATGTIHFRDLTSDGKWSVEWWDTRTGAITARATVTVAGGKLDLPVPATAQDCALKLRFAGASSGADVP